MFFNPLRAAFTRTVPRAMQQSQRLATRTSLFRSYGFATQAFFAQQRTFSTRLAIQIQPFSQFGSTQEILSQLYVPNMSQFDTHQHNFIDELVHHTNSGAVDSLELYNYLKDALNSNKAVPKWLRETVVRVEDTPVVRVEDTPVVKPQDSVIAHDHTAISKKEENLPAVYKAPETDIVAVPAEEEPKKEQNYDNFFKNAQSMFGKATNYFGKAVAVLGVVVAICEILTELDEVQEKIGKKQAGQAELDKVQQKLTAKNTEIETLGARVAQLEKELNTWGQWLLSFIMVTETAKQHQQHIAEKAAAQKRIGELQIEIQSLNTQIADADLRVKEVVTGRVKKGADYAVGKAVGALPELTQAVISDDMQDSVAQSITDKLAKPATETVEAMLHNQEARDSVALSQETRKFLLKAQKQLGDLHQAAKETHQWLSTINDFIK